jgi:hypothetical protein
MLPHLNTAYFQLQTCEEQLTPWITVLLENLTVAQLFKKYPAFYETGMFITVTTTAHDFGPRAYPLYTPPHYFLNKHFNIILSYSLNILRGLFPSGFRPKLFCAFLIYSCVLQTRPISSSLIWGPQRRVLRASCRSLSLHAPIRRQSASFWLAKLLASFSFCSATSLKSKMRNHRM